MKKNKLDNAVKILKNGGVIICPTDTVYGFIADATSRKAVEKIYKIKRRARSKPLPVFVKDIKMAKELAEISTWKKKILEKYWPGKYTFVLKKIEKGSLSNLSNLVAGKDGTIALRIPKYKFLNDLLKKINKPLAQTSVNISGKPELRKIKEIIAQFEKGKDKLDLIINGGDIKKIKSSKIIDLTKNKVKILRK